MKKRVEGFFNRTRRINSSLADPPTPALPVLEVLPLWFSEESCSLPHRMLPELRLSPTGSWYTSAAAPGAAAARPLFLSRTRYTHVAPCVVQLSFLGWQD